MVPASGTAASTQFPTQSRLTLLLELFAFPAG